MLSSSIVKRLTIGSLTTLMCTAGPNVFAHTGVQQAATPGTTSYNAFTITHGCGGHSGDPTPLKVRGQSAVFPFGQAVWNEIADGTETPIPTGGDGIVSEGEDFITLNVGGIQDNDPFAKQEEETDDLERASAQLEKRGTSDQFGRYATVPGIGADHSGQLRVDIEDTHGGCQLV